MDKYLSNIQLKHLLQTLLIVALAAAEISVFANDATILPHTSSSNIQLKFCQEYNVKKNYSLLFISAKGTFAPERKNTLPASLSPAAFLDTATAVFSSRTSLVLDNKVPLAQYYVASTSALNFRDPIDAEIYFNNLSDNLLSYKFNNAAATVVIHLHLQYANPSWTVSDWNSYIQKKLNP